MLLLCLQEVDPTTLSPHHQRRSELGLQLAALVLLRHQQVQV